MLLLTLNLMKNIAEIVDIDFLVFKRSTLPFKQFPKGGRDSSLHV